MACFENSKYITIYLFFCVERDPNSSLPPPLIGGYRPTVFGEEPPENEGYDELCPKRECPDCKRMHALRCEGSAKMYGLTILPYDTNFPGLPNRTGSKLVRRLRMLRDEESLLTPVDESMQSLMQNKLIFS